jgi:hypothetical protein
VRAREIHDVKMLTAKLLSETLKSKGPIGDIHEAEFRVYSQFGDDGIIQHLIHNTAISERRFVEFGVENYTESNTRFLLMNNNWSGLIVDASKNHVDFVKRDPIYWRHDLTAEAAFLTPENVDEILVRNGFTGEIGLLSIDVDGNDYWLWERVSAVSPVIVIVEYNSVFGSGRAVTIPYSPQFNRAGAHSSHLYWGASLRALNLVAERKGYCLVGCNSSGNNAYFVKADRIGTVATRTVDEAYVLSKFRESRDVRGKLSYLSGVDRLKAIAQMPLYDVERKMLIRCGDLT